VTTAMPDRAPAHPAPREAAGFSPSGARANVVALSVGIRFGTGLVFDQWVEIGRRVASQESASLWWLGDWLNYGRGTWGECYRRGIELTGLDYKTLRNYAMVARRFGLSRRRVTLIFHHHAELFAFPPDEQDRWLDEAEVNGWSRGELRRRLQAQRDPKGLGETRLRTLRLPLERERAGRWQQAARLTNRNVQQWILDALDEAADRQLAQQRHKP
jgi:hypothetical protein